jgi:integrase
MLPLPLARRVGRSVYLAEDEHLFVGVPVDGVRVVDEVPQDLGPKTTRCLRGVHLPHSDVLGLKWADIDLGAGTLSVKRSLDVDGTFKTPKNRSSRRALKLAARVPAALGAHKTRQSEERLRKVDR